MKNTLIKLACLLAIFVTFNLKANSDIVIDGNIETAEWQNAQVFESFIQSFPNTGEKPKYPTTTYLTTDDKGIYVAFKNFQPERSRKYSGHDQYTSADFNMVFVDFNNDGDTAYEFVATLGGGTMDGTYSRGNQSSRDWDGDWQVRVSEQGNYWYSEFFIPWTTATYQEQSGTEREISVFFHRFNVIDSQAYSFPDTNRGRKNFTYEFFPVTVNNTQKQSFRTSAYLTSTFDLIDDDQDNNIGVDLTWKPSANQQLIATVKPDFGQVESDELIVNFTAVETLRTDKRPFFTVNQSLFDVQGPNSLKLVNTRRIGANAESDSEQLHDIKAAAKYVYNGSNINSGVLLAKEDDVVKNDGKDFASFRWYSFLDQLSIGQLFNYVSNPINNRHSMVINQDISYRLNEQFNVSSNLLYSNNDDDIGKNIGKGATFKASYVPVRHWENNIEWTYLDKDLNINDFGYMQRNDISTLATNTRFNNYQFDAESALRREQFYGEYKYQRNTTGVTLRDNVYLSYLLQLKTKHLFRAGFEYTSEGNDDLITRQLGVAELPAQQEYHVYYSSPSPATFSFNTRADYYQEGESDWANKYEMNTTTYFTDSIRLNANYTYIDSDDWLIGNSDGQVKRYRRYLNKVYAKLIARLSDSSDITMTTQWFGLKATGIDAKNSEFAAGDDFNMSQFALQARYRKKFDNGSRFYLVYSHNGFDDTQEEDISFTELASNAIANPIQKSIIAKINWVF
ncbi:DUF5916 domain-containing protein [Thalassotalea euphylliae]|uniref:DUF5916 domain-containing protein n=1 Tax=Thalassotalea euphylliae TaxID=1655234 RepID=UPI00362C6334